MFISNRSQLEGVKQKIPLSKGFVFIVFHIWTTTLKEQNEMFVIKRLHLYMFFSTGQQLWRSKTKCSLSKDFVFIFFSQLDNNFERVKRTVSFCYQNVLILNCINSMYCRYDIEGIVWSLTYTLIDGRLRYEKSGCHYFCKIYCKIHNFAFCKDFLEFHEIFTK